MKYVIVGGGVTGTTCAEELRKRDASAQITLLTEEQHPLYSRVLLPHYVKGNIPRERVFLRKIEWYAQQHIDWQVGVVAKYLDARNKYVGGSDGREYAYDKLLIATGGEVRHLDEDLRGVSYLRTLDDADHFLQLLAEQGDRVRAVVYGGGFIACEYLNFFQHFEVPTMLMHRGAHLFSRNLESAAGELLARRLQEHGVDVQKQTTLKGLVGEKELEAVVTNHGEHAATLVGVGIGIEPDFSWLQDAGVQTNAAIVTNEFLQTNVPDIYAAGDCAEFFDVIVSRQLQIGNWMNAMSQGRTVAKSMTGERTPFRLVSSYATNILGLDIIFIADVEKAAAEQIYTIGSVESGGITQVFERDGQVVGGALIGRNSDRPAMTKAIQEQQSAIDILAKIK